MALGVIILLVVTIVLFYLYHMKRVAMQRERVINTIWEIEPVETNDTPETSEVSEDVDFPANRETTIMQRTETSIFITRFKEVVEARLADSDVSVEDLAADMNLSRVQLYRKVKAISGSSPVELLRTARLKRGYQLLLTSDKSVSEVAYEVGFTAPSYFTKCFKDEYGMLPGDVRQN